MIITQTKRLQLRHINETDADFLFDLYNQPAFIEHIGDRGMSSVAKAHQFVQGVLANYAKHGFWLYLVEDSQTGEAVGINGLIKRDELDAPDIGFAISEAYWSKGYAYESSLAVLEHARQLSLNKLLAMVSPHNAGSIHLLEKIGFTVLNPNHLTPDKQRLMLYNLTLSS